MSTHSEEIHRDRIMQGVIPYLAIDGAQRAIAFYKQAFGARLFGDVALMPGDTRVANACLVINGGALMLSDHFPESGEPAAKGGAGFTMQLIVLDGDLWWKRALDAGCEATVPFERQFWGDRYGRLRDPFGVEWALNEPSAENLEKTKEIAP